MTDHKLTSEKIMDAIDRDAAAHGLYFFGISSLDVAQDFQWYKKWIDEGRHGSMEWMTNHLNIREKPELLLEDAKSALIFGFPYFLGDHWIRGDLNGKPKVAQYARLPDYHKFLRGKLEGVRDAIKLIAPSGIAWRVTTDSAPLLERALTVNTGRGFIGKNTCLIHPKKGSFFLLGEILTTWNLGSEVKTLPTKGHLPRGPNGGCGTCKRCQVHCPTGALDQDYRIDARKCLSYWTIEHRGTIPLEFWPWVGRYMFGCDICQLVCPYNRALTASPEAEKIARISATPDIVEIAMMDQAFYESTFGGTPMTRAKRSGLRRNALIAAAVTNHERLPEIMKSLENTDDSVLKATVSQITEYRSKHKNR